MGLTADSILPPEPGTHERGRVLVVDDSPLGRAMLTRQLEAEGYSVREAANGREALDALAREPADMVLLDLVMPEMDGLTALGRMKQHPGLSGIPVIMISAQDEVEQVARAIETGADDYLPKPANPVFLRARVGALIERKRLRDAERRRSAELRAALEQVETERRASEAMLLNILPAPVAEELRTRGSVEPMYFEDVTIVFTDFVGFTAATEKLAAADVVQVLNRYFTAFDRIVGRYSLEKMKTIGDSYMLAAGLPSRSPSHPVDAMLAALEFRETVRGIAAEDERCTWQIRIGAHTGPVVAGVVGVRKFAFDIWGETVNFASRMESSGVPNRINVSERTYARIKDFFACEPRGRVRTKEGREVEMYFVNGIHPALLKDPAAFQDRYRHYFQKPLPVFPEELKEAVCSSH